MTEEITVEGNVTSFSCGDLDSFIDTDNELDIDYANLAQDYTDTKVKFNRLSFYKADAEKRAREAELEVNVQFVIVWLPSSQYIPPPLPPVAMFSLMTQSVIVGLLSRQNIPAPRLARLVLIVQFSIVGPLELQYIPPPVPSVMLLEIVQLTVSQILKMAY